MQRSALRQAVIGPAEPRGWPYRWRRAFAGCALVAALFPAWPSPAGAAEKDVIGILVSYFERLEEVDRDLEETNHDLAVLRKQLAILVQSPLTVIVQKRLGDSYVVESVALSMDGRPILSYDKPIHKTGSFVLSPRRVPSGEHTFKATVAVRTSTKEGSFSPDLQPIIPPLPEMPQAIHLVVVRPGLPVHLLVDIFSEDRWIETRQGEPRVAIRD